MYFLLDNALGFAFAISNNKERAKNVCLMCTKTAGVIFIPPGEFL